MVKATLPACMSRTARFRDDRIKREYDIS